MTIPYLDGNGATRYAAGTHTGGSGDPDVSLETINGTLGTLNTAQATAANQVTGNSSLSTIATNTGAESTAIGAQADAAASADTGTFSLIAITKRIVAKLTSLIALFPTALTGSGNFKIAVAESTAVVHVDDNASSLTVDGTVAATQSGTWNVGTVTTVTGVTNVVHVDDNAGSLTVDGTVAATQSGTWNVNNVSGTVSLPTGASTAAKQPALGTAGTPATDVITVQGAASMTALKTDGSAVTQPVSAASLPLPSGASTAANQTTGNTSLASLDTKLGEVQASPTANTVLDRLKAIATALAGTLTVATHAVTQSGTWTVQPGNTANTTAWKVDGSAVTQPVSGTVAVSTVTSITNTVTVQDAPVSTATLSNVSSSATNVTVLASNSSRKGAIIVNDSTAYLYIKFGATASTSSYTAKLYPDDYYEVPAKYTGIIDGIWSAANGAARVTELT